jgi:hypothetical protein
VSRPGVEPAWVGWIATVSGAAIVIAALVIVGAILRRGRGSRPTGLLLALALPLGLGIDRLLETFLLPGLPDTFLAGMGFSIGLPLLGIALVRFGRLQAAATAGWDRGSMEPARQAHLEAR